MGREASHTAEEETMSLRSMTGYGRGESSAEGCRAEVELRSVNRKQLDIHLNIPRDLLAFEPRIMEEIHSSLSRGRVTGDISLSYYGQAQHGGIRIDEELAGTYIRKLRKTAKLLRLTDDLGASLLVRLPDVVNYEQPVMDGEVLWRVLGRALQKAVRELVHMRVEEGSAMQADLEKRLDLLGKYAESISRKAPSVAANYRTVMLKRLKQAGVSTDDPDGRLLREVAIFADRSDITEELTRLTSHFKQARNLLHSRSPAGRSLDFLAQEMFREINTVGSKANDSRIIKSVVAFKTELERLREQVQNVE